MLYPWQLIDYPINYLFNLYNGMNAPLYNPLQGYCPGDCVLYDNGNQKMTYYCKKDTPIPAGAFDNNYWSPIWSTNITWLQQNSNAIQSIYSSMIAQKNKLSMMNQSSKYLLEEYQMPSNWQKIGYSSGSCNYAIIYIDVDFNYDYLISTITQSMPVYPSDIRYFYQVIQNSDTVSSNEYPVLGLNWNSFNNIGEQVSEFSLTFSQFGEIKDLQEGYSRIVIGIQSVDETLNNAFSKLTDQQLSTAISLLRMYRYRKPVDDVGLSVIDGKLCITWEGEE